MEKEKAPPVPRDRGETVRQGIISVITGHELSAKEISSEVSASEKEVYGHLEHIQRSFHGKKQGLTVVPPVCRACGFEFKKRERLRRPGKCPVCRGESISEPLFSL
ncbi:MAG: transcriptional regulator [Nitrospira sp.]|nr:transcriptional regulator [bacterium]MBL7048175.1 transcriptional regulator [Nitrospira sp.]